MDYEALFTRILESVDEAAYLTPSSHVDPEQREALARIERAIQDPVAGPDEIRALIERSHAEGLIDRVMYYSALHVLAASPKVRDYREAARLVAEQEQAALALGGPRLPEYLASVERHRGVLAFLQGHYDLALDYLSRAFEREHTPENLGNVLCALLRLGELSEARDLLRQVRAQFPAAFVEELDQRILADPDLALLRGEVR